MSPYALKVVTKPRSGVGFRLAGASVEEVEDHEAAARLAALFADPGLGVLAVEEDLLDRVPRSLLERARREGVPVILPFSLPRRWGEAARAEDYVASLIRRAIGYHVKIPR